MDTIIHTIERYAVHMPIVYYPTVVLAIESVDGAGQSGDTN